MKNVLFKMSCNFSFYGKRYSSGKICLTVQTPNCSTCWVALESEEGRQGSESVSAFMQT